MLTMSFANHFYTLWNVWETEDWDRARNIPYIITHYAYCQNLSMNKEEAVKKITAMAAEHSWEEDLSLKGGSRYYTKRRIAALDLWKFTFGKLTGQDMRISNDVWQLNRALSEEANGRRRVYARRRLIELGEMVKYAWQERSKEIKEGTDEELQIAAGQLCMTVEEFKYSVGTTIAVDKFTYRSWCPKKLHAYKLMDKMKGHHFEDGKRVELQLQLVGKVREFEGQYGTSYLMNFKDTEGRMYKYMGSTRQQISLDSFTACKATVKHEEYKGQKETKLQRIKITDKILND